MSTMIQSLTSNEVTTGLALGMGMMLLNLFVLKFLARKMISGKTQPMVLSLFVLVFKFAFFLGATWLILRNFSVNTTALGIGIVSVPLVAALVAALRKPTPEGLVG